MPRLLRLAAALLLFALVAAAPAHAGSRQLFFDASGDNQGAGTTSFASDITQIDVTSEDDGDLSFAVTLLYSQQRLEAGDSLTVQIDSNRDGNVDFSLVAFGQASGQPTFNLCSHAGGTRCELGITGSDRPGAPGSHIVTFQLQFADWFTINFAVVSAFEGKTDVAGTYAFNLNADPDGDGRSGARIGSSGDRCPTTPGGRFDNDRDGCPGPFEQLPKPRHKLNGVALGSQILVKEFRVRNAGRGVTVTVRFAGRTVSRRGSGPIGALRNRRLRVGLQITIIYSQGGRIGSYVVLRVTRSGTSVVRTGCTAPGRKSFSRCP
jgi:hypothetical protein